MAGSRWHERAAQVHHHLAAWQQEDVPGYRGAYAGWQRAQGCAAYLALSRDTLASTSLVSKTQTTCRHQALGSQLTHEPSLSKLEINHPSFSPQESPFGLPVAYTYRDVFRKAFSHSWITLKPCLNLVTRLVVNMSPHLLTFTYSKLSFYISDCTGERAQKEIPFRGHNKHSKFELRIRELSEQQTLRDVC